MALSAAIRHLQRGDWQKAHAIVQNDNTDFGYWAHGIVHMLEGDLGKARKDVEAAQGVMKKFEGQETSLVGLEKPLIAMRNPGLYSIDVLVDGRPQVSIPLMVRHNTPAAAA